MQDIKEQAITKEFLRSIADNNYEIPDKVDYLALARALMPNLASTDEELRDELSYMILASGIIGKQKLTRQQLEEVLSSALDQEHLFFHIGEQGTDTVFMRSFSNLIVAAILYEDAATPVLSEMTVKRTKAALLRYARTEKDWRGYVEGKGWAHTMAHLADALDECAQHQYMTLQDRKDILNIVRELATLPEPLYSEEDVRLANVAYHIILGKQIDDEFLTTWINACAIAREADVESWTRVTNARNFLRSLYFFLHWDGISQPLALRIANILKQQEEVYIEKKGVEK